VRASLLALLLTLGCRTQTPRAAAVAYRFRCDPPQARIIIDEEDRGPCVVWQDRWMALGPGVHRLRVERDPWLPQEQELRPNGRRNTITVTLRREPD
jgi:hypothetical protein